MLAGFTSLFMNKLYRFDTLLKNLLMVRGFSEQIIESALFRAQSIPRKVRWLLKYLKVDSIHLSSRSISAVIYLKVVGAQNHATIHSYRTFSSKESKSFFTTEHLILKNLVCSLLPNIR